MRRTLPVALALAAAACGNPDNIVYGGVGSHGDVPPAVFNSVESALHGLATVTDQKGVTAQRAVVLLTDRKDVCKKLTDNPDYLKSPPEAIVGIILASPLGNSGGPAIGTFVLQQTANIDVLLFVSAGPGKVSDAYFGFGGYESLTQFPPNGQSQGNFDVYVTSQSINGAPIETAGRFKTEPCPGLANAYVPIVR